jgi:hypothetical protein
VTLEESKQRCEAHLANKGQDHRHALQQRQVVDELQQLKEKLAEGLQRCSWEDRRTIVELLVEKIEVTEDTLRVHYIVPLDTPRSRASGRSEPQDPPTEPKHGLCRPCRRGRARVRDRARAAALPRARLVYFV